MFFFHRIKGSPHFFRNSKKFRKKRNFSEWENPNFIINGLFPFGNMGLEVREDSSSLTSSQHAADELTTELYRFIFLLLSLSLSLFHWRSRRSSVRARLPERMDLIARSSHINIVNINIYVRYCTINLNLSQSISRFLDRTPATNTSCCRSFFLTVSRFSASILTFHSARNHNKLYSVRSEWKKNDLFLPPWGILPIDAIAIENLRLGDSRKAGELFFFYLIAERLSTHSDSLCDNLIMFETLDRYFIDMIVTTEKKLEHRNYDL